MMLILLFYFFPPTGLSTVLCGLVKYSKISYENFIRAYNKSKSWLRLLQVCSLWQGIPWPYAVLQFSWKLPELMILKI